MSYNGPWNRPDLSRHHNGPAWRMRPISELPEKTQAEVEAFRVHLVEHMNTNTYVEACRFCRERGQ